MTLVNEGYVHTHEALLKVKVKYTLGATILVKWENECTYAYEGINWTNIRMGPQLSSDAINYA